MQVKKPYIQKTGAYMAGKQIVIGASVLYDGKGKSKDVKIVVEDNYIIDVTTKKIKPHFQGIVTPAFIDAHSHIGMQRQGEPAQEAEVDDELDQFAPLHDPIDSIYFDDRAFSDALDFGVLYSCVVPGSGNLFGGRAKVIRNFAKNRKQAVIKDYGFKMALGYNPRFKSEWKGPRPNTRMGLYSLLILFIPYITYDTYKRISTLFLPITLFSPLVSFSAFLAPIIYVSI